MSTEVWVKHKPGETNSKGQASHLILKSSNSPPRSQFVFETEAEMQTMIDETEDKEKVLLNMGSNKKIMRG